MSEVKRTTNNILYTESDMLETASLLIADDHELIRSGLRQVLIRSGARPPVEAGNGLQALQLIREKSPDIAILDIEMPKMSGYEVARELHDEQHTTAIVFLTMHRDQQLFNRAMDINVQGFVLKENTVAEIVQCVNTVLSGRYYVSPAMSEYLLRRSTAGRGADGVTPVEKIELLTSSERVVLKHLAGMKTSQEIAAELHVSIKTVQNHRNNICSKLGLKGAHALLKFALENEAEL